MGEHHTREVVCPRCGRRLNGAANATRDAQAAPRPGDLSVCIECLAYLRFAEDLGVAELSREDLSALAPPERKAIEEARRLVYTARMMFRLGSYGKFGSDGSQ